MEINPIYSRFTGRSISFETTLRLLQDLLSERLGHEYRYIRVDASNSGRVNFCFTLFYTRDRLNERGFYQGYVMRFQEVKNFRNFRPDGELGHEVAQIENLIETFRNECLSGVI